MPVVLKRLWKEREPYRPIPPPADLLPGERVWTVRFTNEVFRDYDEYLKRMELYRRRVWASSDAANAGTSAAAAAKTPLTYEEALQAEHTVVVPKPEASFPELFVEQIAHLVQHLTKVKLRDVVDLVYDHFKNHYVEGESEIFFTLPPDVLAEYNPSRHVTRSRLRRTDCRENEVVVIVQMVEPAHPLPGVDDPDAVEYTLYWEDVDTMTEYRYKVTGSAALRRAKPPFLKPALHEKVREIAEVESYIGAPWTLKN